jgi:chromate transport protein ChrA
VLDLILNESNINRLIATAAIILPLGCIAFYIILRRRLAGQPTAKVWIAGIGIFGPLVWVLWHVYNAIENAYGLDSVRGLVINLLLFIVVGIVFGLILRLWRNKEIAKTTSESSGVVQEE